jgi:hypothetical protein
VSLRSVQRILDAQQLAPHHIRTFRLSNDSKLSDELKNIVGLYVDPCAHAVVLSVDETSKIQALDRTPPGLPIKPVRAGTMTYDYKRHGTTKLVRRPHYPRRPSSATTSRPSTQRSRGARPSMPSSTTMLPIRFPRYENGSPIIRAGPSNLLPPRASWLNAVEGFFAKFTRHRPQGGVFRSVPSKR